MDYYSGMPSNLYWAQRNKESLAESFSSMRKVEEYIEGVYEKSLTKLCNSYQNLVKPYVMADGTLDLDRLRMARLFNKTYNYKLLRIENQIDQFASSCSEIQQDKIIKGLSKVYKNQVISTFEGFGKSPKGMDLLNKEAINTAVRQPFTADGREFSSRIWNNLSSMNKSLRSVLSDSIANGQSIPKTVKEFKKIYANTTYNTNRIIRTETIATYTKASINSYKKLGLEYLEVLSEANACEDCKSMAGRKVKVVEAQVGVNTPVFHPFCKCTVIPVVKTD